MDLSHILVKCAATLIAFGCAKLVNDGVREQHQVAIAAGAGSPLVALGVGVGLSAGMFGVIFAAIWL